MATGKPGYCGGVCPKKKKKKGGGGDFEMEHSKTGQWWGFKKNRCICLCGTFGRGREGGRGRADGGERCLRAEVIFGMGWENLAGKGGVGFFGGGLDQRLLDYPKRDHYLINPVTNDLSFYNFKRHETHF